MRRRSLFVLALFALVACKHEAEGDRVDLGGGVSANAPKGWSFQKGRVSPGAAYVLEGKDPALLFHPGDPYDPEFERVFFRCAVDGAPHELDGRALNGLGYDVDPYIAKGVTSMQHGVHVLMISDNEGLRGNTVTAYVDTGDLVATIETSGSDSEIAGARSKLEETVLSIKSATPLAWVSPSKDDCARAIARKNAVKAESMPFAEIGKDPEAKVGDLAGATISASYQCFLHASVEPATVAAYEGMAMVETPHANYPQPMSPWRLMFLAKSAGDATVTWECEGSRVRADAGETGVRGTFKLHVKP